MNEDALILNSSKILGRNEVFHMQLQTTYPNNNYPIIVEHNAFEELSEYIQDYDKVFLIIDEYVDLTLKLSLRHYLNQHTYIR